MVIDDKALLKNMKRARDKEAGLEVYHSHEDELILSGDDWTVGMVWANVPVKVFGLIAEYLRAIPTMGEGYKIAKGEENCMISAFAQKKPNGQQGGRARRTPLRYGKYEVWQREENKECRMIREGAADMLIDHGREVQSVGNWLLLEGNASWAAVYRQPEWEGDGSERAMGILGEHDWRWE